MFEYKTININDLMLDVKNSRFNENADSQREAIKIMIDSQGAKIIKLARDIAENGIDPSERLIVINNDDDDKGFIVKEGNRRITALKLLENPSLSQNKTLESTFERILKLRKIKVLEVDCVVYDNEGYNHWINLKHTGQNDGAGRVGWTTPEQLRFMARNGKASFANQLYSFVDFFSKDFADVINEKSRIRITNLDRLAGDPNFRKVMNLNGVEGILFCSQPLDRFISQFKTVLNSMIRTDDSGKTEFTVNRIRSKDDRNNYISELQLTSFSPALTEEWSLLEPLKQSSIIKNDGYNIEGEHVRLGGRNADDLLSNVSSNEVQEAVEQEEQRVDGNSSESAKKANSRDIKVSPPPGINRNHVVPIGVSLKFGTEHKRCHRIFSELKRMTHDDFQNSIAVMLRVFIELTLNTYMDVNGLIYLDKKNPSRTPGLHDKVVIVSNDLFEKKIMSGSKKTAIQSYSKQATNANSSLQQYVHNANLIPSKEFVNTEWDNFQALIECVWSRVR